MATPTSREQLDNLKIDPDRLWMPETGVLIRAQNEDDRWVAADIAHLDRKSLDRWLRSRGGENNLAENFVRLLLGHEG